MNIDNVFPPLRLYYKRLFHANDPALQKNFCVNDDFYLNLHETANFITGKPYLTPVVTKIMAPKGCYKSCVARDLAFHIVNWYGPERVLFTPDNILDSDRALYSWLKNYILANAEGIENDKLQKIAVGIRDEKGLVQGAGSEGLLGHLSSLDEQLRVAKLFLFLLTAANRDQFQSMDYSFVLMPLGFDRIKQEFFCLFKEWKDETWCGNVTVKHIENEAFFEAYDKNKRACVVDNARLVSDDPVEEWFFVIQSLIEGGWLNLSRDRLTRATFECFLRAARFRLSTLDTTDVFECYKNIVEEPEGRLNELFRDYVGNPQEASA